jgi:predicted GNAT family acetyltransferase
MVHGEVSEVAKGSSTKQELIVREPSVSDNPSAHRFEAHVDGRLAGFAEYQLTDELMVFTHTEVPPAFEGQGIGSAIARFALDQLRADGTRKALPVCPFVKGWIERHPDYLDVTYGASPSRAD